MNKRSALTSPALVFSLGMVACLSPRSKEKVSQSVERRDAGSVDVLKSAKVSQDAGGLPAPSAEEADSGCALDIGGGRSGSRTEIGRDGVLKILHMQPRCWLEADCIQERGRDHPGDAMVSIECRGRRCECTFESLAPRHRPMKFTFDTEDPCDDARLKSLLLGRCVGEGRQRATRRIR